jgi:hypothetical protein
MMSAPLERNGDGFGFIGAELTACDLLPENIGALGRE